jgi:hypothetical protein
MGEVPARRFPMVAREEEETVDNPHRHVTVSRGARGWEVCERHDDRVVRVAHYTDWHRVERAVHVFEWRNRPDAPKP